MLFASNSIARLGRRLRSASLIPALAVSVPLSYETTVPPGGHGDLDSPAVWIAPNPQSTYLLVTDKTQNFIEIHDAINNVYLGRLGGTGSTPGYLARPNAVSVAYGVQTGGGLKDVAFVVERDNHRVSVFAMPFGFYLGSIGSAVLDKPMGIALQWDGPQLRIWITDTGPAIQKVYVFDVGPGPQGVVGTQSLTFAVPAGAILETIMVDAVNARALVCDENASDVMVFNLQGTLINRFGAGHFVEDTEGMAIYDTGNGTGYVIVTDQMASPVEWEVFDRQDFHFLRNFSGSAEATDGIVLVQTPLPNFPQGVLFAAHDDRAVHAYDWRNIATKTGLCTGAPCMPVDVPDAAASSAWVTPLRTPLRGTSTLQYRLETPSNVDISVYDLRGLVVARLAQAMRPAGAHGVTWDGRGDNGRRLPSGVYFLRAQAGTRSFAQKVTLIR